MATLKELRVRLKSIGATKQITKALQLVSASKMKRAEEHAVLGRQYEQKITELLKAVPPDVRLNHKWFQQIENRAKTLAVIISPDRGMAGSLNLNLARELISLKNQRSEVEAVAIGRKGAEMAARLGLKLIGTFPIPSARPLSRDVSALTRMVIDSVNAGQYQEVALIATEYVSPLVQKAFTLRLLPFTPVESANIAIALLEPSDLDLLEPLLKEKLRSTIFQYLLESIASEHAARMVAMQNATESAEEILEELELTYHGLRKSKITSELAEIVGGSEALMSP